MGAKQRNRIQPGIRTKFETKISRLIVPLSIKADTVDQSARTFEGLASTWAEDLGSDVIHKGAFKKSIVTWKSSGEAMPLLNSHDHFDIFSALGQAIAMKETNEGLWTKWEVLDGEDGDRVMQRLRPSKTTGRALIGKMSIGFVPSKFEFEQPDGTESFWDRIRHINEADLKEVSLVLFPMNPGASIDATTVKSWLKAAHDADPRELDGITRKELRRLNTRIGLLLKKQKPEDEAELNEADEDSEDEQTPSTRKSSTVTTTTVRTTTTDSDDDDDSDDSNVDPDDQGSDEEDTDTDDTEVDEVPADDKVNPPESANTKKDKDKKDKKEADKPQPYIYQEALQKRLQKVALQRKVGEASAPRD